jgi:hypothetical protein
LLTISSLKAKSEERHDKRCRSPGRPSQQGLKGLE